MNNLERDWMYDRLDGRGGINSSFVTGVDNFIQFALSQRNYMSGNKARCPCKKCHSIKYIDVEIIEYHLFNFGFVEDYFVWEYQGEKDVIGEIASGNDLHGGSQPESGFDNPYRQMVLDAAGPNFGQGSSWQSYSNIEVDSSHPYEHSMEEEPNSSMEEEPNPESQRFYNLLQAADEKLYPGSFLSQLAVVSRMLNIKMENTLSQRGYNQMIQLLKEALPEDNKVLDSYYQTKKLVRSLGLPVEKIDCCDSRCMLYWGDDEHLTSCKFCGNQRYKHRVGSRKRKLVPYKKMYYFPLIPRLKKLYASHATAADMRWHHEHTQEDWVMHHPSDSEAWKNFNETHSFFAAEPRNVRLGLCTDGFQPFSQSGRKYSSWPVIVTPYNLPPGMCMKEAYMFLTVIVPGPNNPKHKIDVYLQPLIKELTLFWETGVEAFDISKKQNFQLRAALMWTISDFPTYSMLSGWRTAGKLACPYCMEETQSFRLQYGSKTSWFDSHRMFLDQHHPFRRYRKNFLKVLNIDKKTKDNIQSRQYMVNYRDRPLLANDTSGKYPKAIYTIDKEERAILFNWVKGLKFPDGYVSNLGRCPDTNAKRLFGMKSHDCHVFMQRLMPIAFRELLPNLTSTTLRVDDMERLEADIPQILCKLERIFPPGFFDSMEHLPVHLPYEAKIAGPVQYRWMYPFERYLGTLKRMIGNNASVEGSICEAYLMKESTHLFSHYFKPHVMTRNHDVDRNDDGGAGEDLEGNLSIFTHPGRLWGEAKKRNLSLEEIKAAQTYILLNCKEVEPFVSMYVQRLQGEFPNPSQGQIDESLEAYFSIWFKEYVRCNHIENKFLRSLAHGPLISATCHSVYFTNGYKFHTDSHGSARSTMNSGVCISDPNFGDYCGRIKEIIQVEFREDPLKQTVLFNCEWFDPTMDVGIKKHNQYKLVYVNHRHRYKKYEPFILAMQATQVCYVSYPSKKKDKDDWVAVLKVKPPNVVELPDEEVMVTAPDLNVPFQVEVHEIDMNVLIDENILLYDPNGNAIEMDEPIDDRLLPKHHEIQDESTEEEYEIEEEYETEETTEDEEEFEEGTDSD
ncbi:uncharacterized protein LOC132607740 [Lycium barbarum]|uniref:uncharacterized protein LOC132607740 n=1 Tax=Lycium barbarum TaxID=112863 RepID=UPI00293E42F4|nr:uncharacterized protein LOC132607740 [Lycium barbarum]